MLTYEHICTLLHNEYTLFYHHHSIFITLQSTSLSNYFDFNEDFIVLSYNSFEISEVYKICNYATYFYEVIMS